MYKIVFSKTFIQNLKKLPKRIHVKADMLMGLLAIDFRDPRLHTKKLHGNNSWYSFRINREYRVLFMFRDGATMLILDIKHRKDIYKGVK